MAELPGVELARPGTWSLAVGGKTEFTVGMLRDAADFYAATGGQPVPIGLGHTDDRFTDPARAAHDGDPAFGLVRNVRYAVDEPGHDPGPVLLGDVTDLPDWLHAAAPTRWPNRSIEGMTAVEFNGRTFSLALTRLAFLGSTPPAMGNLRSLSQLQQALAAAQPIAASAALQTPTAQAVGAPPPMEGAGMSLAKYREVLAGLPDDASPEDIRVALAAAGLSASEPGKPAETPAPEKTTEKTVEKTVETPAAPSKADVDAADDLDKKVAAAASRGGVVTIDASQLAQFQESSRKFAALAQKMENRERDDSIDEAIRAGKFTADRREHYRRSWDADPEGTKTLMASLAAGLVPTSAMGYAGDTDDAVWEAEYRHLFGPSNNRGGR